MTLLEEPPLKIYFFGHLTQFLKPWLENIIRDWTSIKLRPQFDYMKKKITLQEDAWFKN